MTTIRDCQTCKHAVQRAAIVRCVHARARQPFPDVQPACAAVWHWQCRGEWKAK